MVSTVHVLYGGTWDEMESLVDIEGRYEEWRYTSSTATDKCRAPDTQVTRVASTRPLGSGDTEQAS